MSILLGGKVTLGEIRPFFGTTYVGIGVTPIDQAIITNTLDARISATFSQGNRSDLLGNLKNGYPTVVSIALPVSEGVGHALLVVGYDPATDHFKLFDPAYGDVIDEGEVKKRWGFTFDQAWQNQPSLLIPKGSMVTLKPRELPSLLTPGGGRSPGSLAGIIKMQ